MKVCVIGKGYVGLVVGACLAEAGNTVYGVDEDVVKIELLNQGLIPIYEPGLADLVISNLEKERLIFTTDLALGVNNADVTFIAVGTPQEEDGSADLKHVIHVCELLCEVAKKEVFVATKSTVPVGTGDKLEDIFRKRSKHGAVVFSNPEFLKEGDAVNDFMKPERIVIGCNDERIVPLMKELYAPFSHQRNRLIFMNQRSAELTKYAANAMLALRISFMNEMGNLCDATGADVNAVRAGIGADSRIGAAFLYPGLGYGGSCFPKDVKALSRFALDHGIGLKTVAACEAVNAGQVEVFFKKIQAAFSDGLSGKRIAVWGLAFKARTDDIRESPALRLVDLLLGAGAVPHCFDPHALDNVKLKYLDQLHYHDDKMGCLKGAHALVIATDWNEFKSPDFDKMRVAMAKPWIFDGRNLYDPEIVRQAGFEYVGVGVR